MYGLTNAEIMSRVEERCRATYGGSAEGDSREEYGAASRWSLLGLAKAWSERANRGRALENAGSAPVRGGFLTRFRRTGAGIAVAVVVGVVALQVIGLGAALLVDDGGGGGGVRPIRPDMPMAPGEGGSEQPHVQDPPVPGPAATGRVSPSVGIELPGDDRPEPRPI